MSRIPHQTSHLYIREQVGLNAEHKYLPNSLNVKCTEYDDYYGHGKTVVFGIFFFFNCCITINTTINVINTSNVSSKYIRN